MVNRVGEMRLPWGHAPKMSRSIRMLGLKFTQHFSVVLMSVLFRDYFCYERRKIECLHLDSTEVFSDYSPAVLKLYYATALLNVRCFLSNESFTALFYFLHL